MFLEEGCGGDCDGTEFMKCHHADPELVVTLEDEHDLVALLYAEALEIVCGFIGKKAHLAECESVIGDAVLGNPHHGCLVGCLCRDPVDYIESEVELLYILFIKYYVPEESVLTENALEVIVEYGILDSCLVNVGYVVGLNDFCYYSRLVCLTGFPCLGVEDDRIELYILAAYRELTVRCRGVEDDAVAGVEDLGRITDHYLEGTGDNYVKLLACMCNEVVGGIQCLFRVGDGYVEGLAHLVPEPGTKAEILISVVSGDGCSFACSRDGILFES